MSKIIITSVVLAIIGCFPLMGMPGILVLTLSKPFIYLLYGPLAFESFEQSLGEGTWPLIIILSILWPLSIPAAYALCQKLFGELPFFSVAHLIPFCIFVILGTAIISSVVVLSINSSLKRLSSPQILEQALKNGKLSLVKKHLDSNASTTYFFGDPLFVALKHKQIEVAHYLLDNGANPEKYNKEVNLYEPGTTPMHTATTAGMIEIMEKLIQLGVSPNTRSANGKVPLHLLGAIDKETLPVIEFLKTHHANFAAVDHDGNTPIISMAMIHAPLKYRPMLVSKLIEYGCPKNAKNKKGLTALDIVQAQQPYESKLIKALK